MGKSVIQSAKQRLSGWGRCPVEECNVFRPEKRRDIDELLSEGGPTEYIARGLGRSYGDAAINGGGSVISMVRLNRMLGWDAERGIVECEGGVSLEELINTFLPRGWFLPVTPGTKFVTVGGAIAHDVHGKNHHGEGSFSRYVLDLELVTPTGDVLTCSPDRNPDAFWATVGGAGLTGLILSARIQLIPVETAYCRVDYHRCENIETLLTAIRETDQQYKYSVAWVDCLAKGKSLGRSVLMLGEHLPLKELPPSIRGPFKVKRKLQPNVPIDFPSLMLNPMSIWAFNTVFYAAHPSAPGKIIDYDTYFYPLDAIHNWNRIYGKRGFTQYQATFPLDATAGLVHLLEKLSKSSRASFLAVLKRMGPASRGLLSYPFEGYTLTLDIPMKASLVPFLHECDEMVMKHGGRLYLAKDVCTKPEVFAAMYPLLKVFKEVKGKLDPEGRLSSDQARRLRIVEPRKADAT
ncbi:MAG: FAD-binding oxidoreductase [Candidatus Hydrogenedentes bacterium]|nr:FAD-binding oxidoreductase [Candidatus Hydrogenedentota bacterium]